MSRDIQQVIQQVLGQKLHELRICRMQIACLKVVLPLLVEDGEQPPSGAESQYSGQQDASNIAPNLEQDPE